MDASRQLVYTVVVHKPQRQLLFFLSFFRGLFKMNKKHFYLLNGFTMSILFRNDKLIMKFAIYTVSLHCAPEMSEIDCIGRSESFLLNFVRGW